LNRTEINGRWLDMRAITRAELAEIELGIVNLGFGNDGDSAAVRVKGLPFSCTVPELYAFFDGLNVSHGGVVLLRKNGKAA
jgi:hypothetical protein